MKIIYTTCVSHPSCYDIGDVFHFVIFLLGIRASSVMFNLTVAEQFC